MELLMKSFKYFLEDNKLLGKKTPTPEEIAKKHKVTLDYVNKQLEAGIKIEKEHTNQTSVATEIASDHLNERPDYYVRLKKVE